MEISMDKTMKSTGKETLESARNLTPQYSWQPMEPSTFQAATSAVAVRKQIPYASFESNWI